MNESNLREWIQNQEKIERLKSTLISLQKKQKQIEDAILSGVPANELPKVKVTLSSGGHLQFREIQIQPSMTQTFLLSSLKKYFSGSPDAETVFRFILSQRVPKKKWVILNKM